MTQHAISPVGSDLASYYKDLDRAEAEDERRQRLQQRAKQILDQFDAKDVLTALELVGEQEANLLDPLYGSLAELTKVESWKISDTRLSNVVLAFQRIAHFYAGYKSVEETYS